MSDALEEVRRAFPDGVFHIDCNCGYTIADFPMFERLDKLKLAMIEQPLGYGDLHDHAKLQRAIETPICLDESCTSVATAQMAIELGSCRIINIKPPRVGGLSNSIKILDLCNRSNIQCWVGSMLESSIGGASNLAFASLPGISLPSDIFPSNRFYDPEISERPLELSGKGTMRPIDLPASAITPVASRLEARTIESGTLGRPAA
jgi:O-succinylbenzoate synthase